jgi:hypothetical protein
MKILFCTQDLALTTVGASCDYDVAVLSRREVARAWLDVLRAVCPGMPVLFDTVDLHYVREFRAVAVSANFACASAASTSTSRRAPRGAPSREISGTDDL